MRLSMRRSDPGAFKAVRLSMPHLNSPGADEAGSALDASISHSTSTPGTLCLLSGSAEPSSQTVEVQGMPPSSPSSSSPSSSYSIGKQLTPRIAQAACFPHFLDLSRVSDQVDAGMAGCTKCFKSDAVQMCGVHRQRTRTWLPTSFCPSSRTTAAADGASLSQCTPPTCSGPYNAQRAACSEREPVAHVSHFMLSSMCSWRILHAI